MNSVAICFAGMEEPRYVVFMGKKTCIFSTWEEVITQLHNYLGNLHITFLNISSAKLALKIFSNLQLDLKHYVALAATLANNSDLKTLITFDTN